MSYQIKKFAVNVYLKTHSKCVWNLSRLCAIDDQLEFVDLDTFKHRHCREIQRLKRSIPDFVLEHFGLL